MAAAAVVADLPAVVAACPPVVATISAAVVAPAPPVLVPAPYIKWTIGGFHFMTCSQAHVYQWNMVEEVEGVEGEHLVGVGEGELHQVEEGPQGEEEEGLPVEVEVAVGEVV